MSTYFNLTEVKFDSLIKCIFIGDSGVGKSSIIERYINNTFNNNSLSTVGVDYFIKYVFLKDHITKLQIWDLAGQMNYKNIIQSYYRNAEVLFFVFDKGNRSSFDNFEKWINDFRHKLFDLQLVIVGNKSDVAYPSVSTEEAIILANKYEAQYYETSAKDNINIRDMFENTLQLLHDRNTINNKNYVDNSNKIVLTQPSNNYRFNCCSSSNIQMGSWGWLSTWSRPS